MNDFLLQKLEEYHNNILNLRNMLFYTQCPIIRRQIETNIIYETDKLLNMLRNEKLSRQKEFTLDELSKYNGSFGNPAYIAVNGVVYDVSNSPSWGGGTHFGTFAGRDLTMEFDKCHQNDESKLKNLPIVGTLIT